MREAELVVIGGGPAGLAAAVSAAEQGVRDILVLDRNPFLGAFCSSASTTASACTASGRN